MAFLDIPSRVSEVPAAGPEGTHNGFEGCPQEESEGYPHVRGTCGIFREYRQPSGDARNVSGGYLQRVSAGLHCVF